jgi:hypothetical protein
MSRESVQNGFDNNTFLVSETERLDWRLWNFFLIGIVGGGVQLGPVGTAATNRPIVPTPDNNDDG